MSSPQSQGMGGGYFPLIRLSPRPPPHQCDETRPICTRCAHSQRECTWPAEVPKSKKGSAAASESATGSRPSTSSGAPAQGGTTSDSDWQSDSGAAGPIRNLSSAHGRQPSQHSRNSSVGSMRGRELAMTSSASVSRNASVNASRSRDRSPNPFAFSVAQLGPQAGLVGHHQRSASTSSNASASSLPYPLVPQHAPPAISTINVPGLSNSQTSSPSSGAFVQSPTMVWPPAASNEVYGSRPGTSSSLVAGLGNIDLNNLNANAFGTGLDGSGFPGGGDFAFNAAFDGSAGFGNNQFGGLDYGAMDTSMPQGFDPAAFSTRDMDTSSFLAQFQAPIGTDSANYTPSMTDASISGNSSSGSPEMDVENIVGSLDPSTFSGLMAFNQAPPDPGFGGGGTNPSQAAYGSAPASTSAMQGFREAQTPMAASGFGLPQSMPAQNQLQYGTAQVPQGQASGFGQSSSNNNNLNPSNSSSSLEYGSNQGQPAPRHPQPLDSSPLAAYGAMTSTSSPMSAPYPPPSTTTLTSSPMTGSADPSSSPLHPMRSSNTAYGSTLVGTPLQPRPSDSSATGARLPTTMPQGPFQSQAGGVAAGPFTDGARAGAPEDTSSQQLMERTMRMLSGQQGLPPLASGQFPSASSSTEVTPSAADERAQLLSDTPRPSLRQQQQQQQAAREQQSQNQLSNQAKDLQFASPSPQMGSQQAPAGQPSQQFPPSQQSQASRPALTHTRSRSDTITPQNALSPVRSNTLDGISPFASIPAMSWATNGGNVFKKEEPMLGAGSRQWGALSPTTRHMIGNPDPLEPFFKTVQERNLVRSASLVVPPL